VSSRQRFSGAVSTGRPLREAIPICFRGWCLTGAYAIIEDKKGNIWATGEVNPKVWALSRYDAKSLYNKMPTVTEIKSGGIMDFMRILEANDGSIWIGSAGGVYRYDGKTFTDFKSKEGLPFR
jgi:ligand-binding sensor domain-containing protein